MKVAYSTVCRKYCSLGYGKCVNINVFLSIKTKVPSHEYIFNRRIGNRCALRSNWEAYYTLLKKIKLIKCTFLFYLLYPKLDVQLNFFNNSYSLSFESFLTGLVKRHV